MQKLKMTGICSQTFLENFLENCLLYSTLQKLHTQGTVNAIYKEKLYIVLQKKTFFF